MISVSTTGPLAQAVGWTLLHLLWQGALLAALLGLALAWIPAARASLRYVVSCVTLVLLVAAGVTTGLRSYPAGGAAGTPRSGAPASVNVTGSPRTSLPAVLVTAPVVGERLLGIRVDQVRAFVGVANASLPWVVTLWIAGVVLLSLRLLIQWLRAQRLARDHAEPACEPWLSMTRRLAEALGVRQAVRVLESAAIEAPAVLGLFRPVILLPASSLLGLTPSQLEMILAHELAHIRRHDFLVNLLQTVVETLLFYHPAVWWISRRIRAEREHCCDDLAIAVTGTPLLYARALTRLEELRAQSLALAVSASGGSLLDRIRRIVGRTAPGSRAAADPAPVRGAAALGLLMVLLLAIASPSLSAMNRRDPADRKPRREWRETRKAADAGEKAHDEKAEESWFERTWRDETRKALAGTDATVAGEEPSEDGSPIGDAEILASEDALAAVASEGGRTRLSVDDLIALRVHNVTPEIITEMRALFRNATIQQIASMRAVGVTPRFIRDMQRAGLDVDSPDEASGLAAVGVTPQYVDDMRRAGIDVRDASQAAGLRAVGVTPEYVDEMRRAGLEVTTASQASGLRAVGVTPGFVSKMRRAGIDVSEASEAQSLAAVGVTPEYVDAMREAGLEVTTAEQAAGLAAVGVRPALIRGIQEAGIEIRSASEIQSLAAVGVTPEYIRQMRATGIELDEASDVQSLRAMGVTPAFVRKLREAGYTDLTAQDLTRLAAAGVTDDFIREMSKYRRK